MERRKIQEIHIGREEAVIVPRQTWDQMIESLEELEDIKLYDRAKAKNEKTIAYDELCRQLGLSPLRYLRNLAGMTQSQLARKTGLSQSYLAKLEAGERNLAEQTRKKIARVLNLPGKKLIY